MKQELSNKTLKIIKKMQQGELTESVIYAEIAKFAKGAENKKHSFALRQKRKHITKFGNNTPGLR